MALSLFADRFGRHPRLLQALNDRIKSVGKPSRGDFVFALQNSLLEQGYDCLCSMQTVILGTKLRML